MKKNIYEKTKQKQCVVCNQLVMVDQYGNGECNNCTWYQNEIGEDNENKVIFPNLVSLTKARKLVKAGNDIVPSFEDFIEGLLMYGEMQFDYDGYNYGVFRHNNGVIDLGFDGKSHIFANKEEFKAKANINGKLLKNIWHEVKNPNYM